jgi:hypothetical protein
MFALLPLIEVTDLSATWSVDLINVRGNREVSTFSPTFP